jgi:hypothetical protein
VRSYSSMILSTQRNAETIGKKLLGENDVSAVLQRLDRLTGDEARTTAAQTLEIIHGLTQNMRVVIDGEEILFDFPRLSTQYLSPQTPKHLETVSGMLLVRLVGDTRRPYYSRLISDDATNFE